MGGQACVLYGALEFSKDFDFVLLLDDSNLERFLGLVREVEGEIIAVPPFERQYLERGHAVHFRAQAAGVENLRIDIMAKLHGVDPFPELWRRRTTAEISPGLTAELLSLPDLVLAKKTQRDKDWPMIRRLVDVDYLTNRAAPTSAQVVFWLSELRTPEFLIECARNWPKEASLSYRQAVLQAATSGDIAKIEETLAEERRAIGQLDRTYWEPLKKELESLRRKKVKS